MGVTYCVSINGQHAVNVAYEFLKGFCYRGVYDNSEWVGQMEVVLDEDGEYNGLPIKWVDVSYIEFNNIERVLKVLRDMGFSGCNAYIAEENERGEQKEVEHIIL